MMTKLIEKLLLQKINCFKEKVNLESKKKWSEKDLFLYISFNDIKNIKFYFLPFKIKVIDFTVYNDQFSFYFNGKRYVVKI